MTDYSAEEGSASGGQSAERSPTEYRDKQEEMRERQELIHALRNFAEHFGAAEVYQQAKAIYLETADSLSESEEGLALPSESAPRNTNRLDSERQRPNKPARRSSNESQAVQDARRALGG